MKQILAIIILIGGHSFFQSSFSQSNLPEILPLSEQAELRDRWLENRLNTLIPDMMDEEQMDMWLIIASEYNEDPVIMTMLPATWMAARRTTILVFAKNKTTNQIDRWAVARYDIGRFFKSAWDPDQEPDQFKRLAQIVAEYDPNKIGINTSLDFSHANGLTYTEHTLLVEALPKKYQTRLVSAERLAVNWLQTRTPEEIAAYQIISRIAHHIIEEGLSEKVILPGHTTTSDLQWWYRERIQELGLQAWFHPSVDVQRADKVDERAQNFARQADVDVIQPGDLVHMDFGITYLGLNTDTQRNAYILKPGETSPPAGLIEAFKKGNRLQDILTSNFQTGRTGNQILAMSLSQAKSEGLRPSIYTHPLGFHGHAAGPTIGMWDKQGGVPGDGDYILRPNTGYAIELNITSSIPEWGNKDVRIMLEESAWFDGQNVRYMDGRRTSLILIPRVLSE
jgi:Xaa-Pro aminopeptidase